MPDFLQKAAHGLHKNIPDEYHSTTVSDHGDDWPMEDMEFRHAAVLVAVIDKANPSVIFTRRPMHMDKHAGQVSFPGGKLEPQDADAKHTALREAQEEIGLNPKYVNILGCLDIYHIGSGFKICPVVALVSPGLKLTAAPNEVDEIFEVPLDFLMAQTNLKLHSKVWRGKLRQYYALKYKQHEIWGATAGMLNNMRDMLNY